MNSITDFSYTAIISFLVMLIIGPIFIPLLKKLKFGQTIREEGPETHLSKSGTPTMGGIMMMIAILIAVIIKGKMSSDTLVALACIIGFGLIGFLDDFLKVHMKRSLGLRAWQKIVLQFGLALFIALYRYKTSSSSTQLIVPFTSYILNLGVIYVPFMMVVIIGTVNAVNLTDGLDGLASSITAIVSVFFVVVCSFILNNPEMAVIASATFGACIGFLCFNSYPAKVFMGDTGSMALGGAVVAFAIFTNTALIIPFVGGIYFAEALSVIIQVVSFKKRGKRVFLMAPLHHHYEKKGWKETKVVAVFVIVTTILTLISLIALA